MTVKYTIKGPALILTLDRPERVNAFTPQMRDDLIAASDRADADAHKAESRAIFTQGRGADVKEGFAAFLGKRPAAFPGTVSAGMPEFYPWWTERPYE